MLGCPACQHAQAHGVAIDPYLPARGRRMGAPVGFGYGAPQGAPPHDYLKKEDKKCSRYSASEACGAAAAFILETARLPVKPMRRHAT